MRKRVEDLGRIAVLMDEILDLEVWEIYCGRKKDFTDHFFNLSEDKRYEMLYNFIYGLENLKGKLYNVSEIADGRDCLNEPPQ